MPSSQKIPAAMAGKCAAITALTDAFCDQHFNDEYRALIHRAIGALARKRLSPLIRGRESVWAASLIHSLGRVNFLDDPAQLPHCRPRVIFEHFAVAESSGQGSLRAWELLPEDLRTQELKGYVDAHPQKVSSAYVEVEVNRWLQRVEPDESDKYVAMAAMNLVNCVAFARLPTPVKEVQDR